MSEPTTPVELTPEQFEELVADALDQIPPELAQLMDNCGVLVEDRPPAEEPHLLGLYEGVPLTERGAGYSLVLPDKGTIFRGPLERECAAPAAIAREVRVTVAHELAHHLGFDEERLDEIGLA